MAFIRFLTAVATVMASVPVFALQPGNMIEYSNQVETCKGFGDNAVLYKMAAEKGVQLGYGNNKYLAPIKQAIASEIYQNLAAYDDMAAWKFGYAYCWDHIDSAVRQMKADGGVE
ncbi:hypothetical protein [Burkholderia diffusa]|uniref:hypothetical protein n=1 Tax=Burkholderia diffusa TaxID=488732 RepID=UPI00076C94B4|nr:hypothetical protein [Burkholderia diffusa]KVH47345.1 hypothetical protein WJ39_15650 [Burkholderia diffusa]